MLIALNEADNASTLADLDNEEVFTWCNEARENYCAAIEMQDTAWQEVSWDAVRMLGLEAKRRGMLPGWVH